jgi:hypothetical protein
LGIYIGSMRLLNAVVADDRLRIGFHEPTVSVRRLYQVLSRLMTGYGLASMSNPYRFGFFTSPRWLMTGYGLASTTHPYRFGGFRRSRCG